MSTKPTTNVFCKTGVGGGINPTCKPSKIAELKDEMPGFINKAILAKQKPLVVNLFGEKFFDYAMSQPEGTPFLNVWAKYTFLKEPAVSNEAADVTPEMLEVSMELLNAKQRRFVEKYYGGLNLLASNQFCKTGKGGGVKATCGKSNSSSIKVSLISGTNKGMSDSLKSFGIKKSDLAKLVGAKNGELEVSVTEDGRIKIVHHGESHKSERYIGKDARGKYMENSYLVVNDDQQGKGIGTNVFHDQIAAATALGFKSIRCTATRANGHAFAPPMIGYKIWPRLGYDAAIPDKVAKKLPSQLKSAKNISQLMKTPEGRKFWDRYGVTTKMEFSLNKTSHSISTLKRYEKAKAAK